MEFAFVSQGYVICAVPRTGSNFLCQILGSTGVLGRPREYFNAADVQATFPHYPADAESQLLLIPELATTPNGIYGLKVLSYHFDFAAPTRWPERLSNLTFVYLHRHDLLGQAISSVRARQTGEWTSGHPKGVEPAYNAAVINNEILECARQDARWRYYFSRNGIAPLNLIYEDVARDPQAAVDAVARLMGVAEPAVIARDSLSLDIQRDELNEEWRERFIAETRDLAAFL